MKKVLSLVLAGSMILSSMSMAFAATPATTALKDIAGNDYETAIEALVALDVVSGYEDSTFRPAKTITRAELAKLLVEALGYGDLVAGAKANFADTQSHWSNGYVAIANGTGLVIGYPDGTFKPDQVLTYDEVYTMVVRALGYTDASLKGTWPTNFKVKAIDLGLTDDVKMATSAADRGGVAQALYNALEAVLVTVDADNKIANQKNSDDSNKILLDKIASYEPAYLVTATTLNKDSKYYGGNIVDLAPYMYQSLKVYLNDDDEVVYIKDSNSLVVEGTIDKVTYATEYVTVSVKDANGDINKVKFAGTATTNNITDTIFENGAVRTAAYTFADLLDTESITIVATDAGIKDGNIQESEVNAFVLTEQTKVAQVVNEYVDGRTKVDVFILPTVDGDVDFDNVTVTGAVDTLEEIAEDDIVAEYKSNDGTVTKLVVSRETVDGSVTRIDGDKFYIDGTKYTRNALISTVWSLGDNGTFFLDNNGDIVVFDGESDEAVNYAVVVGKDTGTLKANRIDATKFTIDDYPVIKLATQDDETVTYEVAIAIKSSGAVDTSAKLNAGNLLTTSTSALSIDFVGTMPADGQIVKYAVNADGRISKITTVTQTTVAANTKIENLKFASNAVIFDSSDEYAVVDNARLQETVTGNDDKAVYNKNGEIQVLFTNNVDAGSDLTYAYISKINAARNTAGDDVQYVEGYAGNEKVSYLTDASDLFASTDDETVVTIGFDGNVVTENTTVAAFATATTASAVYTQSGRVEFAGIGAYLADNATILTVESDGDKVLSDLNDIEVGVTTFDVYMKDGQIVFIVIK